MMHKVFNFLGKHNISSSSSSSSVTHSQSQYFLLGQVSTHKLHRRETISRSSRFSFSCHFRFRNLLCTSVEINKRKVPLIHISSVIKIELIVDSVRVLSQWVTCPTDESLIELYKSVYIKFINFV